MSYPGLSLPSFCFSCVLCAVVSHVRPWDPMDHNLPSCSVHRILQARILEWVAMPSSRGLFQPRDQTLVSYVSCIGTLVLCLIICCPYSKFNCPTSFQYSCLWISAFYVTKSWHPCPSVNWTLSLVLFLSLLPSLTYIHTHIGHLYVVIIHMNVGHHSQPLVESL